MYMLALIVFTALQPQVKKEAYLYQENRYTSIHIHISASHIGQKCVMSCFRVGNFGMSMWLCIRATYAVSIAEPTCEHTWRMYAIFHKWARSDWERSKHHTAELMRGPVVHNLSTFAVRSHINIESTSSSSRQKAIGLQPFSGRCYPHVWSRCRDGR